ncbi:GNAT family N-acetyltransferase [Pinirhizobacter soli]|uniref:GNAT family N-acetyltransferase n=1 Tax=Pinirhizobacter soli TaxID=2786953 RepID=UPI00202A7449|nr:GNAT family N-acetyltransferase [Pinirhizobacter soli]
MAFINQLEPWGLLREFSLAPPAGFRSLTSVDGVPMFDTPFDLLTTADDSMRASLRRVPGLSRLLRWRTRFVGSTVSEYALFPPGADPLAMARQLRVEQGGARALLIVKDLPAQSPLLSAEENAWTAAFAQACMAEGFVLLDGQALAWVPIDFADEDAYLARLSASRRKNIRRKLRSRADLDIQAVATGPALAVPAQLDEMIALYENVYAQSEIHFDRLQPAYLRGLFTDADSGGTVFLYRHAGRLIGWNLCYEYRGRLVDKYIGLAYPEARTHNLYAVSWMHNLAHARERGLSAYVAGWTDAEVKASLGARFTPTRHAVFARNRLLRAVLRRMAGRFEAEAAS